MSQDPVELRLGGELFEQLLYSSALPISASANLHTLPSLWQDLDLQADVCLPAASSRSRVKTSVRNNQLSFTLPRGVLGLTYHNRLGQLMDVDELRAQPLVDDLLEDLVNSSVLELNGHVTLPNGVPIPVTFNAKLTLDTLDAAVTPTRRAAQFRMSAIRVTLDYAHLSPYIDLYLL